MTNGVMYIAFGEKAKNELTKNAIRNFPVVVVDEKIYNLKSPFVGTGKFSFRAGAVKPYLYDYSPFDKTLYLDVDTIIKKDVTCGFDFLEENDICVSYHVKPNGDIWYVDEIFNHLLSPPISETSVEERNLTQKMIGKRMPFINTGVIFFRKSENAKKFFETWYKEWKIFSSWDEQMAAHRAFCLTPDLKIKLLPPIWNQKYESKDTIISHAMGKQSARKE